ncbi:MAG: nucleotidyltransferase family protein, partial [Planctomycetes bacterium]|nr:nucleotidyltransferase family protein [Planctomycetota bacterium]
METPVGLGNPSQGIWPDPAQELVLRAALCPPHEAVVAWKQWAAANDLDRLDHASVHLLPQVSRNLQEASAEVLADLGRINGLYRQSWYRNQIGLRAAALALHSLADAHVPALLLGGAALVLRYDPSRALRPLEEVGVFVVPSDLPRACAALAGVGWKPPQHRQPGARPRFMRLVNESGTTLDLHTRLFAEELTPSATDDIWRRAEVMDWQDIRTTLLGPIHQLLFACVHGLRWRTVPEVRWLADVALIVEGEADRLDAR